MKDIFKSLSVRNSTSNPMGIFILYIMIGIYKITSPTKKVYIGQSQNIEKRFYYYKRECCKSQPKLYTSIKSHGFNNHKFEVIEECDVSELNSRERYWQDFYNVISDNGLNLCLTATNEKVLIRSLEYRKNASIAQINRCKSISLKQGKTLSENKENTKRLLENNEKKKIKIGVFDFNTNEKISEFNSMRECARIMNIDRKSISWSCKNIYPYAYGFKFEYL